MHPLAEVRSDVDLCIEGKVRNAASQQLIDARLRDAALLGRFKLRPAVLLDQCRYLVHQL